MNPQVDTVKRIYQFFGAGEIPRILDSLAPEVEWEYGAVDHGIPWYVPRRGRAEVAKFFAALSLLEIKTFAPQAFLSGEDKVAVTVELHARVKATGRAIRELEMHLWTFGADGKVARFKHLSDTHQHYLAWRGLPPD